MNKLQLKNLRENMFFFPRTFLENAELWFVRAIAAALLLVGGDVAPIQLQEVFCYMNSRGYHVKAAIDAVMEVSSAVQDSA